MIFDMVPTNPPKARIAKIECLGLVIVERSGQHLVRGKTESVPETEAF